MIIVKICGGLGNQLFQYALYRQLSLQGKEVKADLSWFQIENRNQQRTYKLSKFHTKITECSKQEKAKLASELDGRKNKIINKIVGIKKTHIFEKVSYTFDASIDSIEEGYLDGYWQTEKYFYDSRENLLDEITLCEKQTDYFYKMKETIQQCNSISLHIRRGDYIQAQAMYGNICTEEYYEKAMNYMEEHVESPVFFIFTDDMEWAKNHYAGKENIIFVDGNDKNSEEADLILMSECKHNIIANSSFSWWAAWLNQKNDKIVVAPDKWINQEQTPDIVARGWVHV